jgi:hypothetical protein
MTKLNSKTIASLWFSAFAFCISFPFVIQIFQGAPQLPLAQVLLFPFLLFLLPVLLAAFFGGIWGREIINSEDMKKTASACIGLRVASTAGILSIIVSVITAWIFLTFYNPKAISVFALILTIHLMAIPIYALWGAIGGVLLRFTQERYAVGNKQNASQEEK